MKRNLAHGPWQITVASIPVDLGEDPHLADCELAKKGGPEATLACAECGRAQWMHATRHDTCGMFCWVTHRTITDDQLRKLGEAIGLPEAIRVECGKARNGYGLAAGLVRDAKIACAAAINNTKHTRQRMRHVIDAFFLDHPRGSTIEQHEIDAYQHRMREAARTPGEKAKT